MYSFLSVSVATLGTTDLLHLHMKNPVCKWCVLFLLPQQMYNCAIVQCLASSVWCPVLTQSPSCPWRFKSLGMWCCVFGWVVPNLFFIFRVRQSKPSWAWKWMHYNPSKCREQHADNSTLSVSQKTWIFSNFALGTSDLASYLPFIILPLNRKPVFNLFCIST